MNQPLRPLLFGGDGTATAVTDAGLLVLRVVAGLSLALGHGLGKMPPSPRFVESVGGMGFPLPEVFAWAAGLSELVGGLFLALGLLTRPAAFFVACTTGVAFFLRHAADPFPDKEKALLFLTIAVFLLLTGSGRFGLDRLIYQKRDDRIWR